MYNNNYISLLIVTLKTLEGITGANISEASKAQIANGIKDSIQRHSNTKEFIEFCVEELNLEL